MPKQWICFCRQQGILMIIDLNLMETSCPHDKKKGGGGFEPTEGSSGGRRYMNITIKN